MYTSTWLKIVNRDLIHKGLQRVDFRQVRPAKQDFLCEFANTSGDKFKLLRRLDVEKVVVSIAVDANQRSPVQPNAAKYLKKSATTGKEGSSGHATNDPHSASLSSSTTLLTSALSMMALITGQRPYVTKAHKSIAAWQLRAGQAIGCKTTLRGDLMWEYLEKTLKVALWRSSSASSRAQSRSKSVGQFNQPTLFERVATTNTTSLERVRELNKYSITLGIPDINIYPETDTDLNYVLTNSASTKAVSTSMQCPYSIGRLLASGGSKSAANSIIEEEESTKEEVSLQRNVQNKRLSAKAGAAKSAVSVANVQRRQRPMGLQFTMVIGESVCSRKEITGQRKLGKTVLASAGNLSSIAVYLSGLAGYSSQG